LLLPSTFFAFDSRESAESSRSQLPAALACALRFLYTVYLANTVKTRPRCQPELLNHGSRPCFRAQQQLQPRQRAAEGLSAGREQGQGSTRGRILQGSTGAEYRDTAAPYETGASLLLKASGRLGLRLATLAPPGASGRSAPDLSRSRGVDEGRPRGGACGGPPPRNATLRL
jgi:hypothetical protein